MSENGARTLFFLVYVSFTLIIIHNQWTSGLIYRFSFFRSSLFFSFGQHLCFLVFFTAFGITHVSTSYLLAPSWYFPFLRMQTATSPPFLLPPRRIITMVTAAYFSLCVPLCQNANFPAWLWGPTCSALAAQMYCAAQLSSQQQQMYVFCQLLLFFGFSILNPFNYVEEMVVAVFIFICLFVRFVCTLVCTTFIGFLFHLASRFIL